jgi:hypothetical protein
MCVLSPKFLLTLQLYFDCLKNTAEYLRGLHSLHSFHILTLLLKSFAMSKTEALILRFGCFDYLALHNGLSYS